MSFVEGFTGGYVTGSKIKNAKDAKAKTTLVPTGGAAGGAVPAEASPMDKTIGFIKDKFNSLTSDMPSADPKGSGDVGLVERIKAGNIDDPKSEAYARWGKGKGATVQPAGDASQVSDPDATGPGGTFTREMWDAAPDSGTGANPAWDDLNKNMEA